MAWMGPELVAWSQDENARRLAAEIDAQGAARERERHEPRVVRQTEQCAATCEERGCRCKNRRDDGDVDCDANCVAINRAYLDRCEASAYEALDL
jgi:hypothetical protein